MSNRDGYLTLDKDVGELQLTFEMFQEQINQFSCLRQISQAVHTEMGLESEVNLTKALSLMKFPRNSEIPSDMVQFLSKNNSAQQPEAVQDLRRSLLSIKRMTSNENGVNGNMVDADEGVDFDFLVEGDFFDGDEF